MDYQEARDKPADGAARSDKNRVVWCINQIKRKLEQRRAEKKKENSTDRAARRTANATWAIAFFTLVTICVGIAQWRALHSTDENIAGQLRIMQGQLNAMYNDQRPWVGIAPRVISKLHYGENGISTAIDLRLRNFGKSPALGAKWTGEMSFEHKTDDLLKLQNKICDDVRAMPIGTVIFPTTEPMSATVGFSGGKEQIASARSAADNFGRLVEPVLMVCVEYIFGVDSSRHYTAFGYYLMHVPPFGIIDARDGDLPVEKLLLVETSFPSGYAN